MQVSYEHLKLTSLAELDEIMRQKGWDKFKPYMERLHSRIMQMQPGTKFRVDDLVKEENREIFIKILCYFIWMHGVDKFKFSNDYKYFYRNDEKEKRELERAQKLRHGEHKQHAG